MNVENTKKKKTEKPSQSQQEKKQQKIQNQTEMVWTKKVYTERSIEIRG